MRNFSNEDLRGNKILNLGKGANAIADLDVYLASLNSRAGGLYKFWQDPTLRNITVGDFSATNTIEAPEAPYGGAINLYSLRDNDIDTAFIRNRITNGFRRNQISFNVTDNYFGYEFYLNEIGPYVNYCRFGPSFAGNKVGSGCSKIVTGKECFYNTFGDNSQEITLGSYIENCTFVGRAQNISVGNYCRFVTIIDCYGTSPTTPFVIPANSSNVTYRNNVLELDPYNVAGKLSKSANLSDIQDAKVSRKNLGITDANDKIPAIFLPGGIDDIQEFDGGVAAFPAVGERGVIYVDTSGAGNGYVQYRWSGTQYGPIPLAAGTTDAITEGAVNLYFTQARAIGSLLTGYAKALAGRALAATDSILIAFGIVEKRIDDNATAIASIQGVIPNAASTSNQLVTTSQLNAAQQAPVLITPFINVASVSIKHGRERLVLAQIYDENGLSILAEIDQSSNTTLVIKFGELVTGNVILL